MRARCNLIGNNIESGQGMSAEAAAIVVDGNADGATLVAGASISAAVVERNADGATTGAGAATAASVEEPARQPAADLGFAANFGCAVSAPTCSRPRPIISANVASAREFASRATAESNVA